MLLLYVCTALVKKIGEKTTAGSPLIVVDLLVERREAAQKELRH